MNVVLDTCRKAVESKNSEDNFINILENWYVCSWFFDGSFSLWNYYHFKII